MNNPLSSRLSRSTLALVAAVALVVGLGAPAPAEAGIGDWIFGAAFKIGRVGFHIGYVDHGHGHGDYYYRTSSRLNYRGYRCTDACFHRGSYHYHSASCPVVRRHFSVHGHDAYRVFDRYTPHGRYYRHDRGRDYRYDRYGDYDRYDRKYRYDRRGYRSKGHYHRYEGRRYVDRYHYYEGGNLHHGHRGTCRHR